MWENILGDFAAPVRDRYDRTAPPHAIPLDRSTSSGPTFTAACSPGNGPHEKLILHYRATGRMFAD